MRVCSWSRGSAAGPELYAAFLSSCSRPSSDSPAIISQSDRARGAACLSPVLNHSISAAAGGGGGGRVCSEYLSFPKLTVAASTVQHANCLISIMCSSVQKSAEGVNIVCVVLW